MRGMIVSCAIPSPPHKQSTKGCSVCPDCCYRCNSSREQCQCPWWAERQEREAARKVVAESSFNPQAPDFNPTVNNEPGQGSAGRVLHRPRNPVLLVREPPNHQCKHTLMDCRNQPIRCFDCGCISPRSSWFCIGCNYQVCGQCE